MDTRKIKKDGTHPIILRVYHQGKTSTRSTKIYVNEKQRDDKKKLIKNCHSDSKALNERLLKDLVNLHSGLIKSDDVNEYLNHKQIKITAKVPKITVFTFVTGLISELRLDNKIGNAWVYESALSALKKYHPDEQLYFEYIDFQFLDR